MGFWFAYMGIYGGGGLVTTGCIVEHDIYQSGVKKAQIYNNGQKTAEVYSSGMKTGQAGC
jgi:hypothetical protein